MKLLFLIISALFILSCDEDNPLAPEVRGCTDETACNYDPLANIDNSSCEYLDNCGTCDNDSTNDCIPDCTGVWGGSAVEDNCGICNGDGSTCIDCNGVFAGGASLDNCDICDNDPTNDCVADCAGVWGGSAIEDNCGVCEGGNACLGNALAIANLLLENTLVNLYQQLGNPSYGDSGYWDWYYGNNNNDIEHPSQIDFTDAYNSYMYALSIDSDDPNANFGAALTSFLMITQDPILWEVIDEWENYNGWLIPADDGMGRASTASLIGSGIPMRSEDILSVRNFNILNYIPIGSSFEIMNGDEDDFFSSFPSIAQFQDMIDDVFIARLSQSIGYLENVVGKEYEFMITPQMQSDPYQSPIELDDAEFYALKSSIHILRAILYAINTYDFEFDPASEYSGDFSWMEPGSSFLTIRDGASNHLPSVHDDLNGIVNSLQQVYEFVQTETDYQGDDLILWQELNDTDASDVLYNELPDAINNDYLTEICTGYYDYNYWNYIEDCTDVTINISSFLNNPPSDLKEMIPDYYIETEINNDMWNNWEWVSGFSYQNITIPDCYDINNEGDCISQNGCTYDSMYNICLNSFLSYPGD